MPVDWTSQETCLADLVWTYEQAQVEFLVYITDIGWIQESINAGNALEALQRIVWSMGRIQNMFSHMIRYDTNYTPSAIIPYYMSTYGSVTWEAIIEAWVKDDFAGRTWTIGVIDKMRQLLWDEPFDLTFAARPQDAPRE